MSNERSSFPKLQNPKPNSRRHDENERGEDGDEVSVDAFDSDLNDEDSDWDLNDDTVFSDQLPKTTAKNDRPVVGHHRADEDTAPPSCPPGCPLRSPLAAKDLDWSTSLRNLSWPILESQKYFMYSPIKEWQTRLLILEPGCLGSEVDARLVVVDLIYLSGAVIHDTEERVEYSAVSYCWGELVMSRRIRVNEDTFIRITDNLHSFLQRFRHEDDRRVIWVDAVCINQNDDFEKSTQVQNMMVVYQKAQNVIVWLGEHTKNSKLAVDYCQWAEHESVLNPDHDVPIHSAQCASRFDDLLDGLASLCTRDWVRRIWVKQEVWAASSIVVWIGTSQMSWIAFKEAKDIQVSNVKMYGSKAKALDIPKDFSVALASLQRRKDREDQDRQAPATTLDEERKARIQAQHEIVRLLNESTTCRSTDARDRVIALLGMTSIKQRRLNTDLPASMEFPVDYTRPLWKVYRDLATYIMIRNGISEILCAEGVFGSDKDLDLPSWTPDWRFPFNYFLPKQPERGASFRAFQTRGPKDQRHVVLTPSSLTTLDDDSPVLKLRGFVMATLNDLDEFKWGESTHLPYADGQGLKFMCQTAEASMVQILTALDVPYLWFTEWQWSTSAHHNGFLFAVSKAARSGDIVTIIDTAEYPIVLRPGKGESQDSNFTYMGFVRYAQEPGHGKWRHDIFQDTFQKLQKALPQCDKQTFLVV